MADNENQKEAKSKKCPYCSSIIASEAKKCPVCREYLKGNFVRRISSNFTMVLSLLVSLSIIGVNYFQIQEHRKELYEKKQEIESLQEVRNSVVQESQEIIKETGFLDTDSHSFEEETVEISLRQSIQKLSGKRGKVLQEAFKLKDLDIGFKWGGKKPSEGFDSSGFIAYILHKNQIIKNYESYWSGKLKATFEPVEAPVLGDLIFYEAGYVMFYLKDGKCIGMSPGGIYVRDKEFGPRIKGYGRVNYD